MSVMGILKHLRQICKISLCQDARSLIEDCMWCACFVSSVELIRCVFSNFPSGSQ